MDFKTFHRYNRLAREGKVPALTCNVCGCEVVLRLGQLDAVMIHCYACDSDTYPGMLTCDRVRALVEEFYVESYGDELE